MRAWHSANSVSRVATQCGQSMTEFLIIFPLILLLLFGAIQFAFIYQAKTTLNYAAFQAARKGAVNNALNTAILKGLRQGLAPLFTNDDDPLELGQAVLYVQGEIDAGFVRINRISPSQEAFSDWGVDVAAGNREIPNDNLMYRDVTVGPLSGVNIQDANILKLQVTYCYPLYVPFINRIIATLGRLANPPNADCYAVRRIPIVAQALVRMQSPARLR